MIKLTLPFNGFALFRSPINWKYSNGIVTASYLTDGPFKHWQLALTVRDPAALLDLLSSVQDAEDDVSKGGISIYVDEDSGGCAIIEAGNQCVGVDCMDLDLLTAWLEQAIAEGS